MENQQNIESTQTDELNILDYIRLFLSKWYWIAISCFVCLCVAFFVVKYATKEYNASTSIMILEKDDAFGSMSAIFKDFGAATQGSANIDNQIAILNSYTLVSETLEQLNFQISYYNHGLINDVELYKNVPFFVDLDTSYYDYNDINAYKSEMIDVRIISDDEYRITIERDSITISQSMVWGEQYQDTVYKFTLRKNDSFVNTIDEDNHDYRFVINNYNLLTKKYQKNLTVAASSKKGTIVNLTVKDNVPEKATDFLNGLVGMYIERDLETKNATSKKSEEFINAQLTQITDSLMFAESNLEQFRSNNKIVNLSDEGSLLYEKLEAQEKNKSELDIRLKYYNYILRSIQGDNMQDIKMPSITGIEDPLLNSLISQLNKLYTDKQVLMYSATPDNPSLQIVNMKIEQTITSLVDNVNSLIESTKLELNEVKKEISKTDVDIQQLPSTERELISIQRQFDVNNTVYSFLLQKRAEIGLTKAANVSDVQIIDVARAENALKTFPDLLKVMLIALLLGICIPCAIIFIIDYFDDTIKSKKEIESKLTVPIIGSIIHNTYSDTIPTSNRPQAAITESFRSIRSNLAFFLRSDSATKVIALTSTTSGEGKSFCAMNLASILALTNKKVLIIGLDLRKPRLAEMLNTSNGVGVTSYLIGKNTMDEIIISGFIENLDVIVAGPIPPNPGELIESDAFATFMNECLSRGYDYIVLDTPPIGLVADGFAITKYAQSNIFVMRHKYTLRESIDLVNSLKKENKLTNLCVLLNDVNEKHGYGYYHGRYGGGYYVDSPHKHKSK